MMTGARIRVLGAAFAAVPSSSPHSSAMRSMVEVLRADLDLVTLKTEDLPHTKRILDARMFRVPVGLSELDEQRLVYARAVARQLDAEPYQVVHVLDPWAGEVAAERRANTDFSLIYEITTFPESEEDESGWLRAHSATLAMADRVLVGSAANAAALGADPGMAKRVEIVRPGVDVGGYDWGGVGPFGVPRVLYLGPMDPSRDIDTLLDAIGRVAQTRPVRALLAGERDPARRAAIRTRVEKANLRGVVDIRAEPKPHQIPAVVAAADVCVASSRGRTVGGCAALPQPLLEYLACYRPVVAADVPGVSELVRDDMEGLLYPAGSASALADAILEVLRDAVMRERITQSGYRRVRDELNSGARRRRIREIYELVVPGSQAYDPWQENFEEVTGTVQVNEGVLALLDEHAPPTIAPPPPALDLPAPSSPSVDTAETEPPEERLGEPTRPHVPRPPSDPSPGRVIPDPSE